MADLASLLKHELELLESFAALLAEERVALENGNADALPALAQKKNPIVAALSAAGVQRNQFLRQQGHPEDIAGIDAWLAAHADAKPLQTVWQRFLQTARQARELNSLNALLLSQQLQATNEALAFFGQEAQRQALYGADGQPSLLTGNRVIDSA
ncbi:MAG TPA: flagellar protein FlgN [Rhodocyclaceae bacterium]|nr:flagellar protein FlgN [Rhodocyclaceae bacterium]